MKNNRIIIYFKLVLQKNMKKLLAEVYYSFLFYFLIYYLFNWRLIPPQYCIGLPCQHYILLAVYTFLISPSLNPLPSLPPLYHPSSVPVHQPQSINASCIKPGLAVKFYMWYYTYHSLNSTQIYPPSPSPQSKKPISHICVSFAALP